MMMRTTQMCITRVIIVSLLECERCYKWLCVKCQKVPKAMINALNKYEHLHWYIHFTGTINQIVSNTNRGQNIEQNTVVEKRKWLNWWMNTKEGKMW